MNVLILGNFPETAKRAIRGLFPGDWTIVIGTLPEAAGHLMDAEVLIPEHATVDAQLLDRAPKLRLVQTGAGFDNVVIPECTRRGIFVANATGVNATAVAEHVLAFILCWYKNIIPLDRAMRHGKYSIPYAGGEIAGKTVGVIGLGHVGRAVARMTASIGMEVLALSASSLGEEGGAAEAGLTDILKSSDVITLHCRLDDRTHHLIGMQELNSMKESALLINTSRGGVVDEAALVGALENGKIAGAGLDVYENEPLPEESPLRKLKNVILTPHSAGMPDGLRFHRKRYLFFAENIRRIVNGQRPVNLQNLL